MLWAHGAQQTEVAEFVGEGLEKSSYAFTQVIGAHQHPNNVSKRFVALVRSLDINYLTLHGRRYTHATHLLAMSKDPRMVSERVGQRTSY